MTTNSSSTFVVSSTVSMSLPSTVGITTILSSLLPTTPTPAPTRRLPRLPKTTTTMQPISTQDYTENDSAIALIVFLNLICTCCLLLCVAYSREAFCFAKPKGGKKSKKNEPDLEENDDEGEEEDFE